MRLLLATLSHETNTFSPVSTKLERFCRNGAALLTGQPAIDFYRGTGTCMGGYLAVADELAEPLLSAGYVRIEQITEDGVKLEARSTFARYDHSVDAALWDKRIHASADPGRPTYVHVRVDGWPNQQYALLFVDWLKANPDVAAEYLEVKRIAEERAAGEIASYVMAKEPWFLGAYQRAWEWADSTGWRPATS